jgi:hypothetical protein
MVQVISPISLALTPTTLLGQFIPTIMILPLYQSPFIKATILGVSNASKMFQKPFSPDSWIIVGLKGRLCLNCLNPIYITVFLKVDGKNEMFEPQHECLEPGLYSIEEKEEVLKTSNINLIKQMSILIKAWLLWENCIIEAKEIDAHTPIIGEIKTNQKDHWSARAIKDNFTELKDDNELADFLTKTNNCTFGVFKVYLNQQSSSKFYRFMIIKKEWLL